VEYSEKAWLDYDASQVPPEWHGWLHHITDEPPTVKPPDNHKWLLEHRENTSIYQDGKYVPYSTTRPKIEGWQPGQKNTE
jgi:NADH:ubiquinone oxidoreductase subunit